VDARFHYKPVRQVEANALALDVKLPCAGIDRSGFGQWRRDRANTLLCVMPTGLPTVRAWAIAQFAQTLRSASICRLIALAQNFVASQYNNG
jgi:hypothetical protein